MKTLLEASVAFMNILSATLQHSLCNFKQKRKSEEEELNKLLEFFQLNENHDETF